MTPYTEPLRFILPAIELATAALIVWRVNWRRYPALLAYLAVDALGYSAAMLIPDSWLTAWVVGQPARIALRIGVVCELYRLSCRQIRHHHLGLAIWAGIASVWVGFIFSVLTELRAIWAFNLIRQWVHLELAALMVVLCLWCTSWPCVENMEHRAYRWLWTAIAINTAIGATFVKGGLAYVVFNYWDTSPNPNPAWANADIVLQVCKGLLTAALGLAMAFAPGQRINPDLRRAWKANSARAGAARLNLSAGGRGTRQEIQKRA